MIKVVLLVLLPLALAIEIKVIANDLPHNQQSEVFPVKLSINANSKYIYPAQYNTFTLYLPLYLVQLCQSEETLSKSYPHTNSILFWWSTPNHQVKRLTTLFIQSLKILYKKCRTPSTSSRLINCNTFLKSLDSRSCRCCSVELECSWCSEWPCISATVS